METQANHKGSNYDICTLASRGGISTCFLERSPRLFITASSVIRRVAIWATCQDASRPAAALPPASHILAATAERAQASRASAHLVRVDATLGNDSLAAGPLHRACSPAAPSARHRRKPRHSLPARARKLLPHALAVAKLLPLPPLERGRLLQCGASFAGKASLALISHKLGLDLREAGLPYVLVLWADRTAQGLLTARVLQSWLISASTTKLGGGQRLKHMPHYHGVIYATNFRDTIGI